MVVEVENLDKGFDGRVLIKDLSFTLPRNGIVGVIGPNGVGKTTLFKTIVGLEEPDSGTVKIGRDGQAQLRRPEPRQHRPDEDGVGDGLRRTRLHRRRPDTSSRRVRTSARSGSRATTSRSRPACSPVVSATA